MLTGYDTTLGERVARVAGRTGAHRVVVHDLTLGIEATGAVARVLATGVDTGPSWSALGARHTFGPAIRRNAYVAREARAGRHVAHFAALTVGPAR